MTDHDPSLTPGQEAEVRRLLADARLDEPIPDDVAARLDRTLAELSAGTPATVTELASRRRRTAAITLAAAAAVVVAGVGLGQVLGSGHSDNGSASSAGAPRASVSLPGRSSSASLTQSGGSAAQGEAQPATPDLAGRTPVPIRPQRFAADVAGTLDALRSHPQALRDGLVNGASAAFRCRPGAWGPGTVVPVTYGGRSGVLVFRRPTGDTRVADLYACGSAEVLRSITLPAP